MTSRTKAGLQIIQAAVVIGLAGNLLLRQTPWGLNAFVFVALFVAALLLLWKKHWPEMLTKTNVALASAMVFFASMFLFRDAEELLVFDTLAIIVLMGVLLLASFDVKAHVAGAFHYVASVIGAGLNSVFGGFVLLGADIDWKSMPGGALSRNIFAVLRGVAIALPLLLVFGGLFMAADAVFEGWVNRAINFDIDVVVSHVMLTSVLAWLTAGYFRAAVIKSSAAWTTGTGAVGVPPTSADSEVRTGSGSDREPAGPASDRLEADGSKLEAGLKTDSSPAASYQPPVSRQAETSASEATPVAHDSFVANIAAEQTELENSLPDNATILEHINKSDPPQTDWSAERPAPRGQEMQTSVGETPTSPVDAPAASVAAIASDKKRDWQNIDPAKLPSVFTLGTVETVIILGLVNLLFAGFVAAQLPYLFGGMELVQNTADLKLADYARRGFGELVFVAALVLPMLLVSHWLVRKDGTRAEIIFRVLAGLQIALLFVIMASAVQRLLLLTGEFGYGLTTVRFYPMVFMIWLAVVFAWFAATVLAANARNRFAWGALWSAVVILGVTNLMNPHAFIASTNIRLMQQGRDFDPYYNSRLSDDAIPTLVGSFDKLDSDSAQIVLMNLERRACAKLAEKDLRSWNLARSNTAATLETHGIRSQTGDSCHDWHH